MPYTQHETTIRAIETTWFQFSIGDAKCNRLPPVVRENTVGFNSLLEMRVIYAHSDSALRARCVSILYWRCRLGADDIARAIEKRFNSLLEMLVLWSFE